MKNNLEMQSGAFVLSAIASWFISGGLSLCLASALLYFMRVQEMTLVYVSSALSFISAFFAGAAGIRKRKHGTLFSAFVSAVAIIIIALTAGFLIAGGEIEPAGVLSLVSFTLSGSFAGAILLSGKQAAPSKGKFRVKKK